VGQSGVAGAVTGEMATGEAATQTVTTPRIEARDAGRVLYLDGWRGISLLCVLIGHFVGLRELKIGPLGVDLFFVLSGRLMAEILFVERFPLKRFYARRFSRIFPAMLAFVLIIFVVLLKSPLMFKPPFLATALTFTYNYVAAIGHHRADALDHLWSLCVEEHAYVLLGLIALLSRVRRIPVALIIGGLAVASMLDGVVSSLLGQDWFDAYWRTDTHVASVLVAAALYLATRRMGGLEASTVAPWLSPLCLAMGAAFFGAAFSYRLSYTAGTTLLAVAVCTLDVAPAWMRALLSNRVLTWIGVLSYSIYLWQQPFYAATALEPPSLGRTLALLAGAIAAGAASFYLLEQPARQFLNRVLAGGRSRTADLAVSPAG
jgi:peptidoglycan/LPS O-acetylase OafA/YrhL